jgi:hypothetical protein
LETTPIGGGEKNKILCCNNANFHKINTFSPKNFINCEKHPAGWVI